MSYFDYIPEDLIYIICIPKNSELINLNYNIKKIYNKYIHNIKNGY